MEYFDSPLYLSDVQHALGADWRANARVFVHALGRPLDDSGQRITAGTLIQVVSASCSPLRPFSLDAKLERPDLHLRRLDRKGFPGDLEVSSGHCLLQPLEPPHVFHFSPPLFGPPQFESVALSHASQQLGPSCLLWPEPPIRDLNVRGRLSGSACGAFPRHVTSRAPVFVDSRSICFPFQLRASYTGCMPLDAFLAGVGLSVPDQHLLKVKGTALFDASTRQVTITSGDTVVLQYRSPPIEPRGSECPDSERLYDPDQGDPPDRERTPKRSFVHTSSAGKASTSSGRRFWPELAGGSSGARSLAGLPLLTHDLWKLLGNKVFLVDPVAAACRHASLLSLRLQLSESAARQPVFILQGNEEPLDDPTPDDVTSSASDENSSPTALVPHGSDSHQALPSVPFPELLCVHASVTFFQGTTEQHTLWVEAGESVDSVMVRAQILLSPDPDFATLALVTPQPALPRLSFVRYPAWWHDAGIRALMVVGVEPDACPFVQTSPRQQLAEDLLPNPALPAGVRCSFRAPATADRAEVVLQPDMPVPASVTSASLLHVHLPDESTVAVRMPQQHLASLEHTPAGDIYRGTLPEVKPLLPVFLAHGADHLLLQLDYGSVQQQFVAAFQVPRHHIYLQRQRHTFDQLVIAGKRPSACFGYRNTEDLGRPFRGKGLFLDSRPVGCSVFLGSSARCADPWNSLHLVTGGSANWIRAMLHGRPWPTRRSRRFHIRLRRHCRVVAGLHHSCTCSCRKHGYRA